MHPLQKLRESMGLSQAAFGKAVGRSWQSIQGYEAGRQIPEAVRKVVEAVAVQYGFADLALELGGPFTVKSVLNPGETFISTGRKGKGRIPASSPSPTPSHLPRERDKFQTLLDEVFDSNCDDAIHAVEANLEVFAKYVRSRPTKMREKKRG
jgi:hypothetical protein